jgi:hypothetical protein
VTISLTDVRQELNYKNPGIASADDTELQGFLDAALVEIGKRAGDITTGTTWTETYDGGDISIYLRHVPVLTVTSVTEHIGNITYNLTNQPPGSSVDWLGYSIEDAANGKIVRRSAAGQPYRFTAGSGNVTVTYTAGRVTLPGNLRLATLELVAHWWQSSQQTSSQALGGAIGGNSYDGVSTMPGSTFGIPYRILDMLEQEHRPVIA